MNEKSFIAGAFSLFTIDTADTAQLFQCAVVDSFGGDCEERVFGGEADESFRFCTLAVPAVYVEAKTSG